MENFKLVAILTILFFLFVYLFYRKNNFEIISFIPYKQESTHYGIKLDSVNIYENTETVFKPKINIAKCFLITMKNSKNRYNKFLRNYKKNCTIPLEIIWSIDTKNQINADKYKHLVNKEKFSLMRKFDSGEAMRPDHTYFNSGALGCYLGHMEFYKRCFEQNLDYAIVFEDNVILSNDFMNELGGLIKLIETNDLDFDAIFLHCWSHIGEKVHNIPITKLKWTMSTKCYLINVKNMKQHYPLFYPIDNHVDLAYEKLIYHNNANIYLKNFKSFDIMLTFSNIGHTNVLKNNYVKYFHKDIERGMVKCNKFN